MHIAYIILAHRNPTHLRRLIEKLAHPDDSFFIHLDKKCDLLEFKKHLQNIQANSFFIDNRINAQWGDITIVQATLNLMREALNNQIKFDHLILLSGQDYPIKPTRFIRSFYQKNKSISFINFTPFPVESLNYGGYDRIHYYSFNVFKKRETFIPFSWNKNLSIKGKILNFLLGLRCLFLPKRKFPSTLTPYYGSQWWSMSYDAAKTVLSYVANNPDYLKYHKRTLIPDEIFFQSILINNVSRGFAKNNNYRYIDWNINSDHPKEIDETHFEQITNCDCLFARKFSEDTTILDIIDAKLLNPFYET